MAIKSETKEKIILLLASGVVLGFSRSPRNYFKVLKSVAKEWKEINRNKLVRIVREFYNDRLNECEDEIDFIVEIFLIRPFVRFVRAKSFTNEEQIKIKFGLN